MINVTKNNYYDYNYNIFYWNCRSILNLNKRQILSNFINSNNFDFVFLTETWLDASIVDNELYLDNYKILRSERKPRLHGGVLAAIKQNITVNALNLISKGSPNDLICFMTEEVNPILFILIYNAPRHSQYRMDFETIRDIFFSAVEQMKSYKLKRIYLLGDYNFPNIFWSGRSNTAMNDEDNNFLNLVDELNLVQIIDYPTHIDDNILDLVITNDANSITGRIYDNIFSSDLFSDHFPLKLIIISSEKQFNSNVVNCNVSNDTKFCLENLTDIATANIKIKLHELFLNLTEFNDNNGKYTYMMEKLYEILREHCPTKKQVTKFRQSLPAWYSSKTSHLMKKRSTYRNYLLSKHEDVRYVNKKYKMLDDLVTNSIQEDYKLYFSKMSRNQIFSNIHHHYIGNITRKRIPESIIDTQGKQLENTANIAESFNNYFNGIYVEAQKLKRDPTFNIQFNNSVLPDIKITTSDVENIMRKSKLKGSVADGFLNLQVIRRFSTEIIPILTICFDDICSSRVIPHSWKHSIITPIPKVNKPTKMTDFRPVVSLPIVSKIFERILHGKFFGHIRNYIYKNQHGFFSKRSVISQMANYMDCIYEALDQNGFVTSIYTDVKKAFDCVPHDRLLDKLSSYGIVGNNKLLLDNYLSGRTHSVKFGSKLSKALPMLCGVPQGSVLGPLLFSIYINDIKDAHSLGTTFIYADDVKVVVDSKLTYNHTIYEFDNLCKWYEVNGISLNLDKSCAINFTRSKNYTRPSVDMCLNTVMNCTDLGFIVNNCLSWKDHTTCRLNKAISFFHMIRRNMQQNVPQIIKKRIAECYIFPILFYGTPIFIPNIQGTKQMDSFLFRILKWISEDYHAHYKQLLMSLKLLPVGYYIDYQTILFLYRVMKKQIDIDLPCYVIYLTDASEKRIKKVFEIRRVASEKSRENIWYRAMRLFNYLHLPDISTNWNYIKSETLKVITQVFERRFEKDETCTWSVICDCIHCRLARKHH